MIPTCHSCGSPNAFDDGEIIHRPGCPSLAPSTPQCWRCGGEPYDDPRLLRPTCAACIWEKMQALLANDDATETEPTAEKNEKEKR